MSRVVPFDENAICDGCQSKGAFDFMGDMLCDNCADWSKTDESQKEDRERVKECRQYVKDYPNLPNADTVALVRHIDRLEEEIEKYKRAYGILVGYIDLGCDGNDTNDPTHCEACFIISKSVTELKGFDNEEV